MENGRDPRVGEDERRLLRFSQSVGQDDRRRAAVDRAAARRDEALFEDRPRREAKDGQAEGGFRHQDVGVRGLGRGGGAAAGELEVAGVEEAAAAGFEEDLRGAQDVAGGNERERRAGFAEMLAVSDRRRRSAPVRVAAAVEGDRLGRGEDLAVARRGVVGVRVGEDRPAGGGGRIEVGGEGGRVETLGAGFEEGEERGRSSRGIVSPMSDHPALYPDSGSLRLRGRGRRVGASRPCGGREGRPR